MDQPEELGAAVAELMADAVVSYTRLGPTEPAFREIGELLRGLATRPGLFSEDRLSSLHGSSASATILARVPRGPCSCWPGSPTRRRRPCTTTTPGAWCAWPGDATATRDGERVDDGTDPSRARIRPLEGCELAEGDIVWFREPPHDIHSQEGIDGPAWELVFFGRDPNAVPRAYFDPATGEVTYAGAER